MGGDEDMSRLAGSEIWYSWGWPRSRSRSNPSDVIFNSNLFANCDKSKEWFNASGNSMKSLGQDSGTYMMSTSLWEYSPPKNLNFFLSHVAADKKCKWDQLSLSYVWSWQHCWPSCWHTWCPAMPNISQYDEKMFTPNVWHINITSLVPSFVRQKNNSAPILLYEDRL